VHAIKESLTDQGAGMNPGDVGDPSAAWSSNGTGDGASTEPDQSGYGLSRSCPASPSFQFDGRTYVIDITPLCDWVSLAGLLVLGLAGLLCVRILGSGVA
jgi:hypothetical protein